MSDESRRNDERKSSEWPWQAQLLLFVLVLAAATLIFIFPPALARLLDFEPVARGEESWIAPYVALTAVLISGIFVFMTFRIDRGARHEAREQARKILQKESLEDLRNEAESNAQRAAIAADQAEASQGTAGTAATAAEEAGHRAAAAAKSAARARDDAESAVDKAEQSRADAKDAANKAEEALREADAAMAAAERASGGAQSAQRIAEAAAAEKAQAPDDTGSDAGGSESDSEDRVG